MLDSFAPESPQHRSRRITRRNFLVGAAATGAGVAFYSGTHGRHQLEILRVPLAIRNLPAAFSGFRIVQISDLHLVQYTETWFLGHVIDKVNELAPDLVLITGDFVSRGPHGVEEGRRDAGICAEMLSDLRAPQRFGILGNHDTAVGIRHVVQPLQAHGTPVLIDEYLPIERGSDRFWLSGVDDPGTRHPNLDKAIPPDPRAPVILMAHEPDYADRVIQHPRANWSTSCCRATPMAAKCGFPASDL